MNQLQNVGTVANSGMEISIDVAPVQTANWGVDLGLRITTNHSEVLSLCKGESEPTAVVLARDPDAQCIPMFSDLNGWIIEGQALPVERGRRVINRDEIADPMYEDDPVFGTDVILGKQLPTHFVTPSMTVRFPGNISLSARGEYRGGHVQEINEISIRRSVRSPICYPYYLDPQNSVIQAPSASPSLKARAAPGSSRGSRFQCGGAAGSSTAMTSPTRSYGTTLYLETGGSSARHCRRYRSRRGGRP